MASFSPIACHSDLDIIERTPLDERLEGFCAFDLLKASVTRFPSRPALSYFFRCEPDEQPLQLNYRELLARVCQAANLYRSFGIISRDSIAVLLPNFPQTPIATLGAQCAGVVVPINPLLEPSQIVGILRASEARLLVTTAPVPKMDLLTRLAPALADVPTLRTVLLIDPIQFLSPSKKLAARALRRAPKLPKSILQADFDEGLKNQPRQIDPKARTTQLDGIAALYHTGGTTGAPKLAQHSNRNQLYMAMALSGMSGLTEKDVVLCGLPLFHVNAAMVSGLAPFSRGAHVVLAGAGGFRTPALLKHFWTLVEKTKATCFSAVPTVYAELIDRPVGKTDISSLRIAICGAAPMPPELFKRFEDHSGVPILEGYGLTEGTCATAVNPLLGPRKIGSVGLRFPYQQICIAELDKAGHIARRCSPSEVGHLLIKGPNVFSGYRQEEANHGVILADGWLDTGDLARIDADGYIWIIGRAKDIIIRCGHNIDPAIIEEALTSHPAVALAAAVPRPDLRAGELPVAFVTLRPGQKITEAALLAYCRRTVPEQAAIPVAVTILDGMPLTAVGKIYKPDLRRQAAHHAIQDLLKEGQIKADVDVRQHAKLGPFARITVAKPDQIQAVRDLTANLMLTVDITSKG